MSESRMWFHVIYNDASDNVKTAFVADVSFDAVEEFVRDELKAQEWWIGFANQAEDLPKMGLGQAWLERTEDA